MITNIVSRKPSTGDLMPDLVSGGITWIKPSSSATNSTVSFIKSRIMFSFGYSTENIQQPEWTKIDRGCKIDRAATVV